MAVTKMSLDEVLATPSKMNRATVRATREADMARHMIEDGEDPKAPLRARDIVSPADMARHMIEDGEDPKAPLRARDIVSPADIRKRMVLSQAEFARLLSIPVATLRNWEQNRVAMDPAVLTLMRILAKEPEAAMRALGGTS